tara:strand:+ start:1730 stop:2110 length:381 start_codon:yes stop_codon:yes gene_type:complete
MADELSVSASVVYEKNNHQLQFTPDQQTITVTGEQTSSGVIQVADSSHEAISLGEVSASAQGWAWFRNVGTDTTTAVRVGLDVSSNFFPVFELKGGEFAIMRLANQQLFAKSTSGNLFLQFNIIEE